MIPTRALRHLDDWSVALERAGARSSSDRDLELRARLLESFRAYHEWVWPMFTEHAAIPFVPGYWVDAQCELAQHLAEHGGRAIVNLPPGCGKSFLWSGSWPVWLWLRRRYRSILSFSHNASVSAHLASRSKAVVKHPEHLSLFGDLATVNPKLDGSEYWGLVTGETRRCLAKGGSTGWRGPAAILDDIETSAQVESPAESESTWATITGQILQRVDDSSLLPGIVLACQQRLGTRDSSARLREKWGNLATGLVLELHRTAKTFVMPPGVSPDPRAEGDCLLPPEVYGAGKLSELVMLPRVYQAQGQQDPVDGQSETRRLQAWGPDRVKPFPGGPGWRHRLSTDYGSGAGRQVTVLSSFNGRQIWIRRAVVSRSATTVEQDAADVVTYILEPEGMEISDCRDNVGDVNTEFKMDGLTLNERFGKALGTDFRTVTKGRVGQETIDLDLAYAKGILMVDPAAVAVIECNDLWQGDKSIYKNVFDSYRYGVHDWVVELLDPGRGGKIGIPTVKKRGI